ncbi:LPXTG-domain-containing protein cell wall anchor domain [Gemella sanguinis M325]|uniref:LPXTG cell wall anchor domain-containing protein n=1 Tax=Gemella sanguinis TaxID=84135 RepID=UPI000343C10F|nr:LPXTG cell wall anchor domain-containing protein [Gemella sanguinis]EPC06455.1 LPXTG-domain-containing protein cell wall anchor domain [Gemella sanguinis M325]
MKNNTLLKVLSATAIFSAIAAIEAYDNDDFAFAADENPIVATTNSPATTNKPATNNAATSNTPAVANANAKPAAKQDVKNLKNGEYSIDVKATNFATGGPSMAAAAIKADETKLTVKDGKYSVDITFQPISRDMNGKQFKGYLGDLKYYDSNVEKQNVNSSTPKEATIVESYKETEKDDYFDTYKSKYPERKAYPKVMSYSIDKNKIDSNNKLETYNEVYVPVMDSLMPGFGLGNQKLTLTFDFNTIKEKVTADNYEAATYKNPNKDKEYTGTPLKKEFPLNVQGHLRNANNNDEESLYGPALDSNVKVEKTGDKYKYTFRLKPGLANVGGEFYPFEIAKISYRDKEIPLTTLASSKKGSIKEGSIVSDKLLEKIQLDGTAPYPNGALMSHFVTLQLYYDTANAWKDRPAVLEDVETPKPSPKPTPTKPIEEKPKPVVSTVPDHEVEADKVPNTFPTSVKGELKYQKDNSQLSTYANLFEKDVTVEKVGDKYKYTFKVKEEKGNTFVTKRTNYQFSKITHNGTEATLTPLEGTTKQVSLLANKLLDKLQLKTTVVTKQDKLGNEIDTTLELNFPIVEKPKPVVSTVPDHEVDADKVPSTFPTNVKGELKYQKDNSQLSTYANLLEKDITVEKVGDKYKYTFKVKEAKGNTFVTKRTNYQFSKITHNGTEATLTPLEGTTKQVSLLTDKLLDKLQLKTTLVTKQDKQGNEIDTTLELDFSAVEKNVEKPYNTVPATLLDATIEKPSMGNGALLGEKTRVEKIGDTYHYYVTFKDLQFAGLTGSVDNLKVNGQAADAKDLGGELNEKQYHFTSSDKLTVTPVTIDVLVGGKPFHKNTPARISFNWDKATSLTEEEVNKLHADETAKAEAVKLAKEKAEKEKAEAERLAKEKAEKEKAEAERLAKEKADKEKAEAEKLAKEKAEKEKAEAERLAKEKAEKEKAEAERLAKEKAEKEKAEAERLAKEKAEKEKAEAERLAKEKAEKEKAEAERLAKEKAEKEKAEAERLAKEKADKEKAEKEKAEAERLAKEKAEKEKAEADRLAKEKADKEKAEADRLAKEKAEKEKNQPAYFSNPKVTFNEDKSLATFADNDGDTPVKVTIPTEGLENDVYELEVVKATVPGLDTNNEVYDIHFVTKDGKVRQIKQPASIKVPVERKVVSAYQIDKDGTNKQNIENFSNVKENNVNYVVIEAKHFSLYGFEYENTETQPVTPQPSTNEKEVNKPVQTSVQNNEVSKPELNSKNKTNNSVEIKNNKKELPKTGINTSSAVGLGFIALLSALLLNRKRSK